MLLRSCLSHVAIAAALALGLLAPSSARADRSNMPKELERIGIKEHIDSPLPLDAQFLDESARAVSLGSYFDGKRPVMLVLAYYRCPVLCGMVQNAAATALKEVSLEIEKDFQVVVISIDPRDTPDRARDKKQQIAAAYGKGSAGAQASGFHFLVGQKAQIDRVADAAGFQYEYDAEQDQYGHPAVVMLAKPNGQLSRYLYGLEFNPTDVRLGLLEAKDGRSLSTVEQVILYCYRYDPKQGKYVLWATRLMRLGAAISVLILGGTIGGLLYRERRRKQLSVGLPVGGVRETSLTSGAS